MAEFPIMPIFVDAYLADTGHLTCLEHGAYDLLLKAMWRAGGFLPLDDRMLARTCRLTAGQWRRIKPTIMKFMHPISSHEFTQDKLLETIEAVRRKSKSQELRARLRWLKKKGLADAAASSRHMPTDANHKPLKESYLLDLSGSLTREGRKEAAEREQTKPSEVIPISVALAAKLTNGKGH